MFTGIIEAVGTITAMTSNQTDVTLTISSKQLDMSDVALGDSIATNGVCLTVVGYDKHSYSADVSLETLKRTSFANAKVGDTVNLEKAMLPTTRFGGHIVSGHVDAVGEIIEQTSLGRATEYWIQVPIELGRFIAEKGSITIDGISLTVNAVRDDAFKITIVPHTAQMTTIDSFKQGKRVNIEVDMIARYLERLLQHSSDTTEKSPESRVTLELLQKNGFA